MISRMPILLEAKRLTTVSKSQFNKNVKLSQKSSVKRKKAKANVLYAK